MDIEKRLKAMEKKFKDDSFLNNRGLGNDIPFYIFDYLPKDELKVRNYIKNEVLKNFRLEDAIKIVEIDLFEVMIEVLKELDIFEEVFELEKDMDSEYMFEKLKKAATSDDLAEKIIKRGKDNTIILLTGVGRVYPILRSHNILNKIQNYFDTQKVVLFFPGEYTKTDLILFKKFNDNNYYRAFKLIE